MIKHTYINNHIVYFDRQNRSYTEDTKAINY